jgi:hypothetical protein
MARTQSTLKSTRKAAYLSDAAPLSFIFSASALPARPFALRIGTEGVAVEQKRSTLGAFQHAYLPNTATRSLAPSFTSRFSRLDVSAVRLSGVTDGASPGVKERCQPRVFPGDSATVVVGPGKRSTQHHSAFSIPLGFLPVSLLNDPFEETGPGLLATRFELPCPIRTVPRIPAVNNFSSAQRCPFTVAILSKRRLLGRDASYSRHNYPVAVTLHASIFPEKE